MTIEEVDNIIKDLRQKIPQLQTQLHQAEGYKQALVDMEDQKKEKKKDKDYIPRLAYLGMGAGLIPAAYSLFHKRLGD